MSCPPLQSGFGGSHPHTNATLLPCCHDLFHIYIQAMRESGSREYTAVVEGEITRTYLASVPADIDRTRARFLQVSGWTSERESLRGSERGNALLHGRDDVCGGYCFAGYEGVWNKDSGISFTMHAPHDDPISGILSYCVLDAYEEYTILVWTSDGCLSHSLSLFFNMCHSCSLSTGIHTIAASLLFRILWNVKQ